MDDAIDIEDAVGFLDNAIKKRYEDVQRVFIEAQARHSRLQQSRLTVYGL